MNQIDSYALYSIFLFFTSCFGMPAHAFLFQTRWRLTSRFVKALDYVYFLLIAGSVLRIMNQYRSNVNILIDFTSYTLIAAGIGVRVARTSAEVFDWAEFRSLKVGTKLPMFASRSRFRKFRRVAFRLRVLEHSAIIERIYSPERKWYYTTEKVRTFRDQFAAKRTG
jgi:hypothetical protein